MLCCTTLHRSYVFGNVCHQGQQMAINCELGPHTVWKYALSQLWAPVQYYHGNPDWSCPQNLVAGLPRCPVIWGVYILRVQAIISNISRVVDQVCALKCTVTGSNPSMRPVRYWEVRSSPLNVRTELHF